MRKTLAFLDSLNGVRAFAPEIADVRAELAALAQAAQKIASGDRRLPWNTPEWDEALGRMVEVARTHPAFDHRQCVHPMRSGSWCTNTARLGSPFCDEHQRSADENWRRGE